MDAPNIRMFTADEIAAELLTDNPQAHMGSAQFDADLLDLARSGYMEIGRDLDTGNIVMRVTERGRRLLEATD